MSQEIDAALRDGIRALVSNVQNAVVDSRMTRWRDLFLVGRIVREVVIRHAEQGGPVIHPATLEPIIPRSDFVWLVERCLQRIGDERGLADEDVEAAIERFKRKHDINAGSGSA